MDYAHAWTSAPELKVWLHAHSCHLAPALFVAISTMYVRADQTLGGARHKESKREESRREESKREESKIKEGNKKEVTELESKKEK
jgi:hypothetical protein